MKHIISQNCSECGEDLTFDFSDEVDKLTEGELQELVDSVYEDYEIIASYSGKPDKDGDDFDTAISLLIENKHFFSKEQKQRLVNLSNESYI